MMTCISLRVLVQPEWESLSGIDRCWDAEEAETCAIREEINLALINLMPASIECGERSSSNGAFLIALLLCFTAVQLFNDRKISYFNAGSVCSVNQRQNFIGEDFPSTSFTIAVGIP
jgi:hypothetical protein